MRQMQPVLWTKGVLLTPQHFQTQDRFLEDQLRFRVAALGAHMWGFRELQIDREALAAGTFKLARAAAIFPDGLLYDAPDEDALPRPRALAPRWRRDKRYLDVFLAIPEEREGGNVWLASRPDDVHIEGVDDPLPDAPAGEAPTGSGTRYVSEAVTRRDATTGTSERVVQLARKNVRLVFGPGESMEGMTSLRVARVNRTASDEYTLAEDVIPPLVDIGASEPLIAMVRRLRELLVSRGAALQSGRRRYGNGLASFGRSNVPEFWFLYTINTFLPQIRHLLEKRRGHPETLYTTMLALAGALTTFVRPELASDEKASNKPSEREYSHGDLGACFIPLESRLTHLLNTSVPLRTITLPMPELRPSVFATALKEEHLAPRTRYYLGVATDLDPADLVRRVKDAEVKLSSIDDIDRVVRSGSSGVPLTYVKEVPSEIPVRGVFEYFALTPPAASLGREAWDAVLKGYSVAAATVVGLPNPRFELVVVLPEER